VSAGKLARLWRIQGRRYPEERAIRALVRHRRIAPTISPSNNQKPMANNRVLVCLAADGWRLAAELPRIVLHDEDIILAGT